MIDGTCEEEEEEDRFSLHYNGKYQRMSPFAYMIS